MHRVAAVDLGASSGRVIVGTFEHSVLTLGDSARFPNGPVWVPEPTGADLYWDILALWQGVVDGLHEAGRRGPVDAIGVDTWGVDYAIVDSRGKLVANPHSYRSERTLDAVSELHAHVSADQVYEWNGIQFQPFNTLYQVITDSHGPDGQRSTAPSSWDDRVALLLPDLLNYWLTGRVACEVTNASTTGLIDPRARTWHPDLSVLLAKTASTTPQQVFPSLVEPGAILGPVQGLGPQLVGSNGKPAPVVVVGSHDTASAVVAVPAPGMVGERRRSGGTRTFGFISSGTWSLVGVELDSPVLTEESRLANFTNELGVDGTVRYLKNIMGMWVQQECLRQFREDGMHDMTWAHLDAQTDAAEPLRTVFDINNPVFAAPGDMRTRIDEQCALAGEPIPRNVGEYLRSITESLVVAYRRAIRQAQELSGTTADNLHIVGGGSKNRLLCQLTADATGRTVIAGPTEGTAMGNMLVQLRAIGAITGDLDELRAVVKNSVETHTYSPRDHGQLWEAAEARVFANSSVAL